MAEITGVLTNIAIDGWGGHGALVYVRLDPGQEPPPEGTRVLLQAAAPEPSEPHACTTCGTENSACLEDILHGSGTACCARCHRTDTHGAL